MNPFDELELDILAETGDMQAAELAGQVARETVEDLLEVGCYMLGLPPEIMTIKLIRMSRRNATP